MRRLSLVRVMGQEWVVSPLLLHVTVTMTVTLTMSLTTSGGTRLVIIFVLLFVPKLEGGGEGNKQKTYQREKRLR